MHDTGKLNTADQKLIPYPLVKQHAAVSAALEQQLDRLVCAFLLHWQAIFLTPTPLFPQLQWWKGHHCQDCNGKVEHHQRFPEADELVRAARYTLR